MVCTENSGDAKGKHGTSSNACERTLTNDIKQNVFIQIFLGCEKDKKFCTAQVKGNNCKKITKEAAKHTLPLKKGKRNKNCSTCKRFDYIQCSITQD